MEDANPNRLTRDERKKLLLGLLETLRDSPSTPLQATASEKRLYRMTPESRAMLDFFDKDIDFTDVSICRECFELRGCWKSHGEIFRQRCRCEELTLSAPDETWFSFDFNKLVEFCYCCGAELVQSGFESSVWFCGECKERVEKVNETCGTCVIPMDRFDSADRHVGAKLRSWTRVIVQGSPRASGFLETDPVRLGTLLEALAAQPVDKKSAFEQLCAFLRIDADESR